jgi:cytochrome P450
MTADALYWDPYDSRLGADPWPVFNRIREEAPLYYNEAHDFYALSRFADVERALTDTVTFSSTRGSMLELIKMNAQMPSGTLIFEDPPVHNIHRQLVARVFSPRRVADLEPKIREFCARCLDPLVGQPRFDLIEALSLEMPMRVIGMLIGIPEAGQVAFRDQANEKIAGGEGGRADFSTGVVMSHEALGDYVDWRVKNPSDDVMTELLNAEFEDEDGETRTLTRDEILMYVTVIAGAGNETTGRLIGWLASTLARHPGEHAAVAADQSLVPGAVEEVLRLEPPGPASNCTGRRFRRAAP